MNKLIIEAIEVSKAVLENEEEGVLIEEREFPTYDEILLANAVLELTKEFKNYKWMMP